MSNIILKNWSLQQTNPDDIISPDDMSSSNWITASVPGTVAQALLDAGLWNLDVQMDFDAYDWWYRCTFSLEKQSQACFKRLRFNGLASLADIWLNGDKVLSTDNMFRHYEIDISSLSKDTNELMICFRSVSEKLKSIRSRPQWKTKLVKQQQLRWIRTSLLGRIPGWMPPVAPVGPWQSIEIIEKYSLEDLRLECTFIEQSGHIQFTSKVNHQSRLQQAELVICGELYSLNVSANNKVDGEVTLNNIEPWFPHTHGKQSLYDCALNLIFDDGDFQLPLGRIGFRKIDLDSSGDKFALVVNDTSVFCRGACWTVNDVISLCGDPRGLRHTLELMQQAGANLIRIGGTMLYEQDLFYETCDELGIMVWQDFMFANMDFPFDDKCFVENCLTEIKQQFSRLNKYPSVVAYCGGSEVEQQVAMLGLSRESWEIDFYQKLLPEYINEYAPGSAYVSSSPSGGDLPFSTNQSLSHYYGVGAYLSGISEVRTHDVKFTSETLGFANIPIEKNRNYIFDGDSVAPTDTRWKSRTPRDTGTGWDFEDIRDHYLASLYECDPVKMRCYDTERYLQLSEIVSGEIVSQVFDEWRSGYSNCDGGIIWFLKDFWLGAGWGVIDSENIPKAIYYYLKRNWQPINVCLTNETLNGIHAHITNEISSNEDFIVALKVLNMTDTTVVAKQFSMSIKRGKTKSFNIETQIGHFLDLAYSYRFGPESFKLIHISLRQNESQVSEAYHFPNHKHLINKTNKEINYKVLDVSETLIVIRLTSNEFLYSVCIDVDGYQPDDNFFHVLPDEPKVVSLRKMIDTKRFKCFVSAINSTDIIRIKI